MKGIDPFVRSNFLALLKEKFETQCRGELNGVLTKTWEIISSGIEIKDRKKVKKIKGIQAGLDYLVSNVRKFRKSLGQAKIEGQIRSVEDCEEVITGYRKRIKTSTIEQQLPSGPCTFLENIDQVFNGVQLGDLCIIAAFVSHGKSTFVANMAYNAAFVGFNGIFQTLEMTYEEMRDMIYVLHTSNEDWKKVPKYKHLAGKITYENVRRGLLSPEEQEFFETAALDFVTRQDYGTLYMRQPPEALTPSGLEMEMYDKNAELMEMQKKLDYVIVDYLGLMIQDREERYGDWNVDLNGIIKRMKNLALTFNSGKGTRIISPFQINREGWKEAVKNDGVYQLTALSNAHEAERSADQIIALFTDNEKKKAGTTKICCLKHRKGAFFDPFEAAFDYKTKRISNFNYTEDPAEGALNISEIIGI
jgi:replicative DNA helicase